MYLMSLFFLLNYFSHGSFDVFKGRSTEHTHFEVVEYFTYQRTQNYTSIDDIRIKICVNVCNTKLSYRTIEKLSPSKNKVSVK